MKYFDKKAEKLSWLYILAGIPIGALVLWKILAASVPRKLLYLP